MSTWWLLLRKEGLESARNYKWLWIPLVFLLLGISSPISTYYMPQILQAGGVTEEAAKLIPIPLSPEILIKSLSQYGTLGLLVLALSFMGIVAAERQSGSAIMVLVKPVSHTQYVLAKWSAMTLLTLAAVVLGQLGCWYYIDLLFEPVSFYDVMVSCVVYAVWLVFVNSLTLLFSCILRSQGGVAFLSLAAAAVLTLVTNLLGGVMKWSPSRMTDIAGHLLLEGDAGSEVWVAIAGAVSAIVLLLLGAIAASKRMWVKVH